MTHSSPVDLLREYDARARAIVVREVRTVRALMRAPDNAAEGPPRSGWFPDPVQIIRGASRERMRIRHALRALETPSRALALLRVV